MMMIKTPAAALLLSAAVAVAAMAQDAPPAMPVMREVSPGMFEIGKMRLDQKAMTLTFPGALNMNSGLLEYLLVTPRGSTHESLLVSEVSPNDVHFAMLLLGAKGGADKPDGAPPQIDAKYLKTAPKMTGDTVLISVKWTDAGGEKTVPVEDWLYNETTKKPIEHGPWIYNGSIFQEGRFLAQTDGTFAALVTNPSALINNPRKGNDDDQMWGVNEKAVPPVNTPVEIIFKLVPPADAKPSK